MNAELEALRKERDALAAQVAQLHSVNQKALTAFRSFISGRRELKGIHGQTVGSESYRLDFTGHSLGEVEDAFLESATTAPALVPESDVEPLIEALERALDCAYWKGAGSEYMVQSPHKILAAYRAKHPKP